MKASLINSDFLQSLQKCIITITYFSVVYVYYMKFLLKAVGLLFLFCFFVYHTYAGNPGAQYGCLLDYNSGIIYTSYSNDGPSPQYNDGIQYPFYDTTTNKKLNKNNGRNVYTCGEINTGFATQDINLNSSPGNCYVNGIKTHGQLRQYSIALCNAPLDDYVILLVHVMAGFGFLLIRKCLNPL